jgi:hypothetical protein
MIHLLADETPLSILDALVEPVVIYDATGTRVIGHYTPVDPERGQRLYAELAARIDPEELARRVAAADKGRSLAEILRDLEARPGGVPTTGSPPVEPGSPSGREGCATP